MLGVAGEPESNRVLRTGIHASKDSHGPCDKLNTLARALQTAVGMNHELRTHVPLLSIKGQRDIVAVRIHRDQLQTFANVYRSSHNSLDTFEEISLAYYSIADGQTISLASLNKLVGIVKRILMRPGTRKLKGLVVEAMKPVSRTSLSDEIVQQITALISREVLKPGERLPSERELCKRFGVGRTSLREALRSLAVMGILDGRVGEGTFVSSSNNKYLAKSLQWGLLLDRFEIAAVRRNDDADTADSTR